MGVNLTDKMAETKTIHVTWGEDVVDVTYKVNAVTPRLLEEVDEAAKRDNLDVLGTLLEPVIQSWDVWDNGQQIGTDTETIKGLPMRWITAVQRAMEADLNPPEEQN